MVDFLRFFEIELALSVWETYSEIFTVTVRVVFGGDYLADYIFAFLSVVVY